LLAAVTTTEKYADEPGILSFNSTPVSSTENTNLHPQIGVITEEVPKQDNLEKETNGPPSYTPPLLLASHYQTDEDIDEKLFLILQNAVRETYFSYRDILGKRYVRIC